MNNEINPGDSEPEQNSVDNITPSDLINRRSKDVEEVVAEENNVAESSNDIPSPPDPTTDVLSNVDLDNMSETELKDISQKLGTKAVARFGELTARRKQAEERMQRMEQELETLKKEKEKIPVVKDNPLKDITDPKKLQQHHESAREVIEWAEALLDDHEDYKSHDVVTEVDGREYTKSELKKTLRQSRDVVNKFVPAQAQELQKRATIANNTKAFQRKAVQEFDWMKDKNNATTKRYQAMVNDKRLADLHKTNPELSSQMPYILAHAANSMYGRKVITNTSPAVAKTGIKPPASRTGSAATPERKTSTKSVAQKEVQERYKQSGTIDDFIALRTLQKSQ